MRRDVNDVKVQTVAACCLAAEACYDPDARYIVLSISSRLSFPLFTGMVSRRQVIDRLAALLEKALPEGYGNGGEVSDEYLANQLVDAPKMDWEKAKR